MAIKPRVLVNVGAMAFAIATTVLAGKNGLEGRVYHVYRDSGGVPTVCEGHTGPDVKMGQTYTEKQCNSLFQKDLSRFKVAVEGCIYAPMAANQEAAYMIDAFNVGSGAFCGSHIAELANKGNRQASCEALLSWHIRDHKGHVLNGLIARRKIEYQLCTKP